VPPIVTQRRPNANLRALQIIPALAGAGRRGHGRRPCAARPSGIYC